MAARLSTNQGDRLKAVFESIRDYISECRLIFRPETVEFVGQDSAKVVVFRYIIQAKSIRTIGGVYEFDSSKNIEVSVKTRSIAAHLRCSSPRDTITFEIDPNIPDKLIFKVQNSEKDSRVEIVLPVPDGPTADTEEYNQFRWNGVVTMSSSLFHDMIRDLSAADPYPPLVHLYCDGYVFQFTANGFQSKVVFTVSDQSESQHQQQQLAAVVPKKEGEPAAAGLSRSDREEEEEKVGEKGDQTAAAASAGVQFRRAGSNGWPVSASYPISFMQRVIKAKNVCSKISICVREDYPIAFVYHTQIGILTYIITPRVEEDVMDSISGPPPGANKRQEAETGAPRQTWQKRRRGGKTSGKPSSADQDEDDEPNKKPQAAADDEDEEYALADGLVDQGDDD